MINTYATDRKLYDGQLTRTILILFLTVSINFFHCQKISSYNYPESIIREGNYLYMTGDGSKPSPMEKNGDGVIKKLSLDGKIIDDNISKGILDSPKGTSIINDVIYVADIDKIVGVSLKTGEIVKVISFEGKAKLLNDITVMDKNTLLVSATDINKIFKISLNKKENNIELLKIDDVPGANGVFYNKKNKTLYVVGFGYFGSDTPTGQIGKVTWNNKRPSYSKINSRLGYYDGLQIDSKGNLLISDWRSLNGENGEILVIDPKDPENIVKTIETKTSPADFFYDKRSHKLFIPTAMINGLQIVDLK